MPDARASAIALHAFSFFVGQALGVALFGLGIGAMGWTASLVVAALAATALGLVSAWVLVWGPQPRPRQGGMPGSGSHTAFGGSPVCQNAWMGMPPRGYQ